MLVLVPKTPVNEYSSLNAEECQIRRAWKALGIYLKSRLYSAGNSLYGHLRRSGHRPDSSHEHASLDRRQIIHGYVLRAGDADAPRVGSVLVAGAFDAAPSNTYLERSILDRPFFRNSIRRPSVVARVTCQYVLPGLIV
jgi:hypothetical protein